MGYYVTVFGHNLTFVHSLMILVGAFCLLQAFTWW